MMLSTPLVVRPIPGSSAIARVVALPGSEARKCFGCVSRSGPVRAEREINVGFLDLNGVFYRLGTAGGIFTSGCDELVLNLVESDLPHVSVNTML